MVQRVLQLVVVACCATRTAAKSQGNQDALLREIFDAVRETNRFFVEFGFNAPSFEEGSGANTQALWEVGWHGLLLDGGRSNATINLVQAFISSTNIVQLFRENSVPIELDFLSVDMDSADLWVLRAILSVYRPRVIIIEFNSNYDFDGPLASAITFHDPSTMPTLNGRASWNGTCFFGASAKSIVNVASANGYELVASEAPFDLFFVRGDVWKQRKQPHRPLFQTGVTAAYAGARQLARAVPNHAPMTISEAQNLLDYDVYARTGSLCEARAAATRALKVYAQDKGNRSSHRCFRFLRGLEPPKCGRAGAHAVGSVLSTQLGRADGR